MLISILINLTLTETLFSFCFRLYSSVSLTWVAHYFTAMCSLQAAILVGFSLAESMFSLCSSPSFRRCSFYVPFSSSLNLHKTSLTCKGFFSFMLQYYMHARHLALSRTFPDKFEMEPSAPPKVKSAFGEEFICILATLQREGESVCQCVCMCVWKKERKES